MTDVLDTCGCEQRAEHAPAVFNRPGLPALHYRIGTHGELLRRMLRRITRWTPPEDQSKRPLAFLTSRAPDDPAIALLDAWAVVGDVLSFYQERIANEGFLRTATERRSVLELARSIGYELNPGVAASTYLVWEVDASTQSVRIAAGTKVQSMPGQDELPQTFETSSGLIARSDLNQLRPRLTVPQPVGLGSRELFIAGTATGFVRGDRVLITGGPRHHADDDGNPLPGDPPPGVDVSLLNVLEVDPQVELQRTRLALEPLLKFPPKSQPPAPTPDPPDPPIDFTPPKPPTLPPVKPAELDPPVFALVQRPLTATEIEQRILDFLWTDAQLLAQAATQWWDPSLMVRWVEHHLHGPDLGPVSVWVPVKPPTDTKHPMVISVFPPTGAVNVHPNPTVVVAFSEPMDKLSLEPRLTPAPLWRAVTLREGAADGSIVPVDKIEYVPATGSVRIIADTSAGSPDKVLKSRTNYFVVVDTTAKDANGLTLGAKFVSRFTTADITAPVPLFTTPNNFATNVPAVITIEAKFNEQLDIDSVTRDSVFLRDATGVRVPADVDLIDDQTKITLRPRAPLALSTTYTATLTDDITDVATPTKNKIAVLEWQFTTALRPVDIPDPALRVYGFREQAAFFGHNAPKWSTLPDHDNQRGTDPYPEDWDNPPRSVWIESQGNTLGGDSVYLDREVQDLEPKGWTVFETETGAATYYISAVSAHSVADYGISGRASRLQLSKHDGTSPSEGTATPADFRVRETAAHVRSEELDLVELPITTNLKAGDTEITLNGMVVGLESGRLIALRGMLVELSPLFGSEILELHHAEHAHGFTTLIFKGALAHSYVRPTVTLNANVVVATHGESGRPEILGGGDGTQANQRFTLRRPPLTYVSDFGPTGAKSTLEIRIDGVRWDEARVLYGLGARSRGYIVRRSDDNVASVIFGEGDQGARPPTGTENIVATYRTGIGLAGMLGADRLTLLRERPLGITSVNNPLPTTGAAEPENRDEAKTNAPLTVLTMERIVSLRDFEDFARAFAGIGKAQAAARWDGDKHRIHVTVAPATATQMTDTDPVFKNLKTAILAACEPGLDVTIEPYDLRYFHLEAAVRIEPAYFPENVLKAVQAAVAAAFSFRWRSFGQAVTAPEVIKVVEAVPGVVATYLKALYLLADRDEVTLESGVEHPLEDILPALGAELLLVNPAGITITERTT
jgi:hypothetical protein